MLKIFKIPLWKGIVQVRLVQIGRVLITGALFFIFPLINGSAQEYSAGTQYGPFFWSVQKNGHTSYIMGTVHTALDHREIQCFEEISHRLSASHLFFMEHPMPLFAQFVSTFIQLNVESSSPEPGFYNLSKESQEFFVENFPQLQSIFGFDEHVLYTADLSRLDFIYNNLCLFNVPKIRSAIVTYIRNDILDNQMMQLAQSYNVPYAYLDDYSFFPQIDGGLALKIQAENELMTVPVLEYSISNYESQCTLEYLRLNSSLVSKLDTMDNLNSLYKAGMPIMQTARESKMRKMREAGVSEKDILAIMEERDKHWFKSRNKQWLIKILNAHQTLSGGVFISAGLGHFTGPDNVLDMLKAKGFTIRRFGPACTPE